MPQRKIVKIDEEKCDGCGLCVPSCAEGAIQIVQGKARLVADVYCDGLGACLGHCPRDAITVIQREAEPFDEQAAQRHVAGGPGATGFARAPSALAEPVARPEAHAGCPGSAVRNLNLEVLSPGATSFVRASSALAEPVAADDGPPAMDGPPLCNWPIQLRLVPPNAAFLKQADLFLVADCAAFAFADFHRRVLRRRPIVIGCPKLDDAQAYVEKLAQILSVAEVRSLTVVHMEVPCCLGLVRIAQAALVASGSSIPLEQITISIRGQLLP